MREALYGGRRFRTLNALDEGNREGLTIEVGTSIPAALVIRVLDQLATILRPALRAPARQRGGNHFPLDRVVRRSGH